MKIYSNNHGVLFINDRQMPANMLSLDPFLKGTDQWYNIYIGNDVNPFLTIALADITKKDLTAYSSATHFEIIFWLSTSSYKGVIDIVHQKIHEGLVYTFNMQLKAVANNGVAEVLFTATTKQCHIIFQLIAGGEAEFNTFLNPTITSNGTAPETTETAVLTSFQRNSIPPIPQTATVFHTPSYSAVGLKRGNQAQNGGTGGTSTGGQGGTRLETIVNPGEKLLVRLKNISGNAKNLCIIGDWYEVQPDI